MSNEEQADTSKSDVKQESRKSRKQAAADKVVEDLQAQLGEAKAKADEYLDLARHVQADFENYRRRIDREAEDRRRYAALDIVKELLNVADDLGRALENADPADPLAKGVKGVRDNLAKILEGQGVKEIPADGAFDPNLHEALTTIEGDEEGKIAMVAQKGYTMHDKVIRYAKVVVTRKKEEQAAPKEEPAASENEEEPAAPAPEEGPAEKSQ